MLGTDSTAPKTLEVGKPGSLKTLWRVQRPAIKLTGDEVAVKVRAAGMSFKVIFAHFHSFRTSVLTEQDILVSIGVVDGNVDDGNGLDCGSACITTQVGPGASFQVGDQRHGRTRRSRLSFWRTLYASWKCVAETGKIVEIGNRDSIGHG